MTFSQVKVVRDQGQINCTAVIATNRAHRYGSGDCGVGNLDPTISAKKSQKGIVAGFNSGVSL